MMDSDALVPLRVCDIAVGKPLPWPVYGPNRKLLLREGFVIETQKQLDVLVKDGVFRNPAWSNDGLRLRRGTADHASKPDSDNKPAAAEKEKNYCLDEMKPRVGDAVQLQIQDERYPVQLMGYLKGKTVMVSTPVADGGVVLLREGQSVVLRSFSGKDAYGFSASILRVCNMPIPYLHLTYPKSVQSVMVRKTQRAETDLIGAVINTSNGAMSSLSKPVKICDLSISGASFVVKEPVGEKGDTLSLSFRVKLNELDTHQTASCMVPTVNCIVRSVSIESEIGTETGRVRYGVQFSEVPLDVSIVLQNVIYQKLLENA